MLRATVLLLSAVIGAQSACPEGWQAIGEKCYLIGDTNQNWFAARQFCAHNDGHLAEFDSEDDLLELLPLFYEGDVYSYDFWFGLNDLIKEDTWIYDYSENTASFDGWEPGQPDEDAGSGAGGWRRWTLCSSQGRRSG